MRRTGRRPARWSQGRGWRATAGVALALLLAAGEVARAREASDPTAGGEARAAACPDRDAVLSALRKLGAREDPEQLGDAAVRAGLELEDLGDRFRVTVGDRARDYGDAERDCPRRARLAAVFCALVLAPDGAGAEAPEAPTDTAAEPAPPRAPRRRPR